MKVKSSWVIVYDTKSYCPGCHSITTLLQHQTPTVKTPMFFICWSCKRIFEAGKGEVFPDDKKVLRGENI